MLSWSKRQAIQGGPFHKKIRLIALVLLLAALFVSIDFGFKFLWSMVPEANDGLGNFSVLHSLFGVFGNH